MPPLTIIGLAIALDGDTLRVGLDTIRLHGIDAPEARQWCVIDRRPYPCGAEATAWLAAIVASHAVSCTERSRDRYRRIVAVCRLPDGTDIGRQMVRDGHAVAFVRYSLDYQPDERFAQAARAGLWRGTFTMPWDWRAQGR